MAPPARFSLKILPFLLALTLAPVTGLAGAIAPENFVDGTTGLGAFWQRAGSTTSFGGSLNLGMVYKISGPINLGLAGQNTFTYTQGNPARTSYVGVPSLYFKWLNLNRHSSSDFDFLDFEYTFVRPYFDVLVGPALTYTSSGGTSSFDVGISATGGLGVLIELISNVGLTIGMSYTYQHVSPVTTHRIDLRVGIAVYW